METVTVVHSATCVNGKRNYQPGPNWYKFILSVWLGLTPGPMPSAGMYPPWLLT